MTRLFIRLLLLLPVLFAWAAGATPKTKDLDALWARRDEVGVTAELVKAMSDALASDPDTELLWRASRLRHWQAELARDKSEKVRLLLEGVALGERAESLSPHHVAGPYFIAVNLGAYAEVVGVAKALTAGVQPRFTRALERAQALDERWDGCGVHLLRGRYFFSLPWPKRDLSRSRSEFALALGCGANARASVFLAEALLESDEDDQARSMLRDVATRAPGRDAPDDRLMKARAQSLLATLDKEKQ